MTRGRCGSLFLQRMKLAFTTPCRFLPAHGQSHESILLTRLVPISVAPEAQWMLAPRFSVGKTVDNSHPAPSGRCKHRLSLPLVRSCDCPAPLFRMGILLPQFAYNFHSLEHNNRWETRCTADVLVRPRVRRHHLNFRRNLAARPGGTG